MSLVILAAPTTSESTLRRASTIEGLRFTAQVVVPQAVQGLFRRRRKAVAAATRVDLDGQAIGLIRGLRRSHGDGPLWIRVVRDEALLLTEGADIRQALEGSPDPYAPDPDAKRKGMAHFQPDALTISRGETWRNRRGFAEAVLDNGKPAHRDSDRFAAVIGEELTSLLEEVQWPGDGRLEWEPFNECVRRITRRIVFGDRARDDTELSELLAKLMDEANSMPGERSAAYEPFMVRVRGHIAAAEPGCLAARFADAPSDQETKVDGQATHWLFALGDTLAINAWRCLALLAGHGSERLLAEAEAAAADLKRGKDVGGLDYLRACLHEAMRLWPTTPLLSRETIADTRWHGETVPGGTQLLISNVFNHRDSERFPYADRFAPDAWISGDAGSEWAFNHFSHGPQGCPGVDLALFVGSGLLGGLLLARTIRQRGGRRVGPDQPMPHMLDYFSLSFELEPSR